MKKVTPKQVLANNKLNIIDIWTLSEHAVKSYAYANRIGMSDLLEKPSSFIEKDQEYFLLCGSGNRATKTAEKLNKNGFKIGIVEGGIKAFDESKLIVNPDAINCGCGD